MQIQWEYIAAKISGGSLIQGLNKLGADGWQVATIEHQSDGELVILKRPKPLTLPNMGDLPMVSRQ